MSKYYCTNCGADIGKQNDFDINAGYCYCEKCGTLLYDPDDLDFDTPTGTIWFCDDCGACLNKQWGFSESWSTWECSECGYENDIDEDHIFTSREEYQKSRENSYSYWGNDDEDDEEEDDDDECDDDEEDDDDRNVKKDNNKRTFSDIWHKFVRKLRFFCGVVLICVLIFIGINMWNSVKIHLFKIPISFDSYTASKYTYKELKDKLIDLGFENITVHSIDDLEYKDRDKEEYVYDIVINNENKFAVDDEFSKYAEVVIVYHTLKNSFFPISFKEAQNQDYKIIEQTIKDAGFENITVQADYDIILGFLAKENTIETILVDGSKKFKKGTVYKVDVPVIITYHAKLRKE